MATFHRKDSFLRNTAVGEGWYLGINKLPKLSSSQYDEDYLITADYHQRPDKLAYAIYENTRLWWVFALRNPDILKDPIRDFAAGTSIKLPSAESIKKLTGV